MESEPENEITVFVFRLLVLDLLALFQALNQAMINILGEITFQHLNAGLSLTGPQATFSKCPRRMPRELWTYIAHSHDKPILSYNT